MPLHPQARDLIDTTTALKLPAVWDVTPAQARETVRQRSAALPREDVASVRDHRVPVSGGEITVRVFTPRAPAPLPALVYFHGGGWVTGDIESHEGICRTLANAARCAVVSVDYRLAPEAPYPAGPDDCEAAALWLARNAQAEFGTSIASKH